MRKSNAQPLSEVIREYLKAMQIDGKLKEVQLINQWDNVVGKAIARRTTRIYINKQVLFVHLNSSIVKNELMLIRQGLVKTLNDRVGEKIINDIVLR